MSQAIKILLQVNHYMSLNTKKPAFGVGTNKGTDQPAHPPRLIRAFVIRLLESIISKLATGEISIF